MKTKIVILIKWIIFCAIVLIILTSMTPLFENRKSADDVYETFQGMSDTPDVLIFGTSRAQLGIDPNVMYEEYGIRAFNLASPSQHLDTIEYVMDSMIQQKKPKVILIITDYMDQVSAPSTLNHEILTIRKIKGNEIDKWNYLYNHFGFRLMEYVKFYFPIFQFHKDILDGNVDVSSLKENGHLKRLYQKGFSYSSDVKEIAISGEDMVQKTIDTDVLACMERLERKCEEQDIKLMFVTLPTADRFPYSDDMKQHFDYLNTFEFWDDIGLDENRDFGDEQHVNINGSKKLSVFLGNVLKRKYDLQDCRIQNENNLWDITLPVLKTMDYAEFDSNKWEEVLLKEGYKIF